MSIGPDNIRLRWPTVVGRVYQLQSRDAFVLGDWINETGELVASKSSLAVKIPTHEVMRLFRVVRIR